MKIRNSELRAELGTCLRSLESALNTFSAYVLREAHDAWQWRRPHPSSDALAPLPPDLPRQDTLNALAAAICKIKYEDN
jgi:hypothetical protein